MSRVRQVLILLVEDNAGDVLLTREALADSGYDVHLDVVGDGEAALVYLRAGGSEELGMPDLMLLDLNLPGLSGSEVLATVKGEPAFATVPVIVLSSTKDRGDVDGAYRSHANTFITKPDRFSDYASVVRRIEDYWFDIATTTKAMT